LPKICSCHKFSRLLYPQATQWLQENAAKAKKIRSQIVTVHGANIRLGGSLKAEDFGDGKRQSREKHPQALVIPAQTYCHSALDAESRNHSKEWIPAFAGMTVEQECQSWEKDPQAALEAATPVNGYRKSSIQNIIIPLAGVWLGVYNPPGRACSIMTDSGVSTVEMASSCEFCYARRNRFVFRRGVSKIHTAPPSPVGPGIGCDNSPARPCDRPVPPDGEAEKRKTIAAEYRRGSRDNTRAA
jgi:hypothetical protein